MGGFPSHGGAALSCFQQPNSYYRNGFREVMDNGKSISMTDTVGMLLAAVKAQSEEMRQLKGQIALLQHRMNQ